MASERVQRRIERLLHQIEEAADQQNWDRERQLTEEVLSLDPNNVDPQTFLVAAERSLTRISGSIEDLPSHAPEPIPPPVSSVSAQPTSFANGRYQVKRFLGEGGLNESLAVSNELARLVYAKGADVKQSKHLTQQKDLSRGGDVTDNTTRSMVIVG